MRVHLPSYSPQPPDNNGGASPTNNRGDNIPPELYEAVAQVLVFIDGLDRGMLHA